MRHRDYINVIAKVCKYW